MICLVDNNVLLLHYAEGTTITSEVEASKVQSVIDIDTMHTGPQMCSLYAADVYGNLRTAEVWIAVDLSSSSVDTFLSIMSYIPNDQLTYQTYVTCARIFHLTSYLR